MGYAIKRKGNFEKHTMQLTIFTDYGLRVLMYLAARPGQTCNVREIAGYYGISRNHLVKVAHRLAQSGLVVSAKGRGGGLRLAGSAGTMRLGDLVRMLEPHMKLVECFDKDTNRCRITESCGLRHFLSDANAAFIESLNRNTLEDTLAPPPSFLSPSFLPPSFLSGEDEAGS
ncbi:MAG: Rrf2 family transcriptional regulator [Micavibrio sp.]